MTFLFRSSRDRETKKKNLQEGQEKSEQVKKVKPEQTIAICVATGQQGKEVIQRFKEINEAHTYGQRVFHMKALTRNTSSKSAMSLSQIPNVTVVEVNYESSESLTDAFQGVDALFLNYVMCENEAEVEKSIIDAALLCGVSHIVYASHADCEGDHGVPHWESSRKINEYLHECLSRKNTGQDFKYHLLRLTHFNENFSPKGYFPPKNGVIACPFRPDVRFATHSLRDVARVTCKLFAEPWKLGNGSSIHVSTELVTYDAIAKVVSKAKGEDVSAIKAPWVFTTFGHWFGWEASSILHMANYLDENEFVLDESSLGETAAFLGSEEIKTEPLETIEMFANRIYG